MVTWKSLERIGDGAQGASSVTLDKWFTSHDLGPLSEKDSYHSSGFLPSYSSSTLCLDSGSKIVTHFSRLCGISWKSSCWRRFCFLHKVSEHSGMSGPKLKFALGMISVQSSCLLPFGVSILYPLPKLQCPSAALTLPGGHTLFCVSMGNLWIIHYDYY